VLLDCGGNGKDARKGLKGFPTKDKKKIHGPCSFFRSLSLVKIWIDLFAAKKETNKKIMRRDSPMQTFRHRQSQGQRVCIRALYMGVVEVVVVVVIVVFSCRRNKNKSGSGMFGVGC